MENSLWVATKATNINKLICKMLQPKLFHNVTLMYVTESVY